MDNSMFNILESKTAPNGTVIEVLEFKKLEGSSDIRTAKDLFYISEAGMSLKMVRITLNNSKARLEPGALYYMQGDLEIVASTGGGLLKGLSRKVLSGESFFVNEIQGTGEIYLEPSFGHFFLYDIQKGEDAIIVDKGLFYAGTSSLDISAASQKNLSSAALGGEGLFQTKIAGQGIAVLYSPVPMKEIQKFDLVNDTVHVDGNFALLRSEKVTFSVTKSSKSWLATSVSGEGFLQKFQGTGQVWIAPTQGVYEKLTQFGGIQKLSAAPGSMNTNTKSSK